ncbi:MAG: hypothetical protein JO359_14470 [Candidatus Eremiobacteraeota bacterium]|nr:hypothetical protein [Candidatus Eremiobacteraeota bacterium]
MWIGLAGRVRKISPLGIGMFAAAAGAAAIYAYDACADAHAAPGASCDCWVSALWGLAAGILVAALITVLRALVQPLLASMFDALGVVRLRGVLAARCEKIPGALLAFALAPQALHRALRAPPAG